MISQTPVYNLSAVLKETGLKADVLRVWEKRYALPNPGRSQGGQRLYSQYDIEAVKWLRARQLEGLNIGRAVELWRGLLESGRDPLQEYQPAALPAAGSFPAADTRMEIIRQQWLDACLGFDGDRAEEILNQAFAIYPVEMVCTAILQQGLTAAGALWFAGKASVQQEHFISSLAARRIEALIQANPRPTRPQTILVGCPAGEMHTFPLLLLNLFLRRKGWKVVYLGADVPGEDLLETARAVRPVVIILAAQHLVSAAALQAQVKALRQLHIPLAYGGLIFNRIPALRQRIPAWFLGETIDQALQEVERLALETHPGPAGAVETETFAAAAALFSDQRPLLELALLKRLPENDRLVSKNVADALVRFGDGLAAALQLGDPALLEADLAWVNFLLSKRELSADHLTPFLRIYCQVAGSVLGPQGAAITGWLEKYIENQ